MAKETLEQYNKRVKKVNDKFNKLTNAEKRVRIAKDVLEQIKLKRIKPESGSWLNVLEGRDPWTEKMRNPEFSLLLRSGNPELQELFGTVETCNACALGSVFMCAVERANELKLSDVGGALYCLEFDEIAAYLKNFFSESQLKLIELAFERGDGYFAIDNYKGGELVEGRSAKLAVEFKRGSAEERLVAIMKNIIKNKGTFKP